MNAQRGTNPIVANQVLAGMSDAQWRRLRARLEPIHLDFGQVVYEPGETIRFVYFPLNSLISLFTAVGKRRTLEVGMVGNEGMAGMSLIMGVGVSSVRALVQGEGEALRMAAGPFRIEFNRNRILRQALLLYMHALMTQISQTAACSRFHPARARLARWLMMTRDRGGRDEFPLTHDFLGHMLGLRRVGIAEAASTFRQRKLISYHRGVIQILDAKGLEASCCSCYRVVKDASERALTPDEGHSTWAAQILQALSEQTVVVLGTQAASIVLPRLAQQLAALRVQRDEVAKEVERLVLAHPLHPVLTGMPGVGVRTAARLLIDVVSRAFASAGHLAAYAGLAPVTRRSGSSIRGELPSRRGNKQLKRANFLQAFAALRDPVSRAYYARKISQGKRHNQALIALARRRCDVLFAMLRDGRSTPHRGPNYR